MASTSRKVLLVVLALLLLIGTGLYYLSSNLNGIVASVIEKQGSAAIHTSVRVSDGWECVHAIRAHNYPRVCHTATHAHYACDFVHRVYAVNHPCMNGFTSACIVAFTILREHSFTSFRHD